MIDLVSPGLVHLVFYYITEPAPLLYDVNICRSCEIKQPRQYVGVHKEVTSTLNIKSR